MDTIIGLLGEHNVFTNLKASKKEDVLKVLIESFKEDVEPEELDAIKEAVLEREKIMSTGVGKGLAIPHGKVKGIRTNFAAFASLELSIDYQSIDGQPVDLVFLLVGPHSSNSLHIKMLSRISRLMNNDSLREKLSKCNSSKEIIDVFKLEEESYFGS